MKNLNYYCIISQKTENSVIMHRKFATKMWLSTTHTDNNISLSVSRLWTDGVEIRSDGWNLWLTIVMFPRQCVPNVETVKTA